MSLYRGSVDKQREGLPNAPIAEQRVLCLDTRTLAVDLGPGIGVVELDVLDIAALHDLDPASGIAPSFQFEEDLVLDLHVPSIIVLAGLNHRACGRDGIAAALHLDRVEIR